MNISHIVPTKEGCKFFWHLLTGKITNLKCNFFFFGGAKGDSSSLRHIFPKFMCLPRRVSPKWPVNSQCLSVVLASVFFGQQKSEHKISDSLKLTAKVPENKPGPKRKLYSIPTIHFQGLLLLVPGSVVDE